MLEGSLFAHDGRQINLYSKASRQAMIKLGFVVSDLQPIDQDNIMVPSKFQNCAEEYIQGKVEYAQQMRIKRVQLFIHELDKWKKERMESRSHMRISKSANASRININVQDLYSQTRKKSSNNKSINYNRSNALKQFQQNDFCDIIVDKQIKKLSLAQKKTIYRHALQQNSPLLNLVYPGVKRNHKKQNMLLRPKINKMRNFNVKQNIKAQEAEQRRSKKNRIHQRLELKFNENKSQLLKRLQQINNKKKRELELKKRVNNQKAFAVKVKRYEQNILNRQTSEIFKNNLTNRLQYASQMKQQHNRSKVKNQSSRNRLIMQRKQLKRNPYQKIRLAKCKSQVSMYLKHKAKTQQQSIYLLQGNNERVSYDYGANPFSNYDQQQQIIREITNRPVVQAEQSDRVLIIDTPICVDFLQRVKNYLQQQGVDIENEQINLQATENKLKQINEQLQDKYYRDL